MERAYLDWNATAPLRPQAQAAMEKALALSGNPSSVHAEGRAARALIEEARCKVAAFVGTQAGNVVFTSGGTEANMLALSPALMRAGKPTCERLLISAIEHPSVRQGGRFAASAIEEIAVDPQGRVSLEVLKAKLSRSAPALVSVMLANNETGAIQPISEVADIVHDAGGLLHVDAVQAAGRIVLDLNALKADLLTISAHKLGGPKGVGALLRRDEYLHLPDPLIKGGGQERNWRAGTENVAGIAGFGAAADAARSDLSRDAAHMAALRQELEQGLRQISPKVTIFCEGVDRVPNTTLFAITGMKAEIAVIAFDLEGIAVSSGAACSSGKVQSSHVLEAMSVDSALTRSAIRVSLGPTTTKGDIALILKAWIKLSESLGKGRGIAA